MQLRLAKPVLVALAFAGLGEPAQAADPIRLPSGGDVAFHEAIWGEPGPAGLTVRFRFIDPDLATKLAAADQEGLADATEFLCESYALDRISNLGPQPSQIVISIADRETEFGEPNPEATQIFEAYSFDGSACIWEGF